MADYSDWQVSAINDLENTDLSYGEIGAKYGRSRDTIIKLKAQNQVVRRFPTRRTGAVKAIDVKPLSAAHRAIGIRLGLLRGSRNYSDLAAEMLISRHVLKNMELGGHDFTLSQLIKISEIMGQDVNELMTPIRVSATPFTTKERHDR